MGEDKRKYILGAQEGPGRLEARAGGGLKRWKWTDKIQMYALID